MTCYKNSTTIVGKTLRYGDKTYQIIRLAKRHQVPKWSDDANDLINDEEVGAVYIATPPGFHKEYAIAVAQAGKPVYIEKPMALNVAECQDMVCACKQAVAPLFVAYYRRALPKLVQSNSLMV